MMERPLLTADELKSIPKGSFIVQKTTRSVKGEGQLHDAPVQEMVVAEDIDYDRMPHKRTPYNLPRQEVDR